MNKSYKSVWNEALGAWVAVCENAVARGKRSRSRVVTGVAVGAAAAVVMAAHSGEATAAPIPAYDNLVINTGVDGNATASAPASIAIGNGTIANGAVGGDYSVIAIGST